MYANIYVRMHLVKLTHYNGLEILLEDSKGGYSCNRPSNKFNVFEALIYNCVKSLNRYMSFT